MKSKKNIKSKRNKTVKHRFRPSLKILHKGYHLYASKTFTGDEILKYTREQEEKYGSSCLFNNMSWFGDYPEAKEYETKDTHINKWKVIKKTRLLKTNEKNQIFFEKLFIKAGVTLETAIKLNPQDAVKIKQLAEKDDIKYDYITLSQNERALYEFKFAYGYISLKEQYEFMKLIRFLINNQFVDIKTREGKSIVTKLTQKIDYYYLLSGFSSKEKYHRLSFYDFDRNAMTNLCKLLPAEYEISGVFQANTKSFWYPNVIFNKIRDIKEYVLFNPHHTLVYEKIVKG